MKCENHEICSFAQSASKLPANHAHKGYYNEYCTGENSPNCVRRKISNKYTGTLVPSNMLPDGTLMSGTDTSDWDPRAKEYVRYL